MKKILTLVLVFVLVAAMAAGCSEKGELNIIYGETHQITLKKEYPSVTWESSDPNVATVKNGEVTAVEVGEAVITATVDDKVVAEYSVNVSVVAITDIRFEAEELTLKIDETATPNHTLAPENATVYGLTYSSSDESVATVDQNGKLCAVAPGTAQITLTSSSGVTAVCSLTVEIVDVEEVTFKIDKKTLKIGESIQLSYTLKPTNATVVDFVYASSDPSVATVDDDGLVVAVAPGTAQITLATPSGKTAVCEIKVREPNAIDELNSDEKKLFDFLVEQMLPDFYQHNKVRIGNIYHVPDGKSTTSLVLEVRGYTQTGSPANGLYAILINVGVYDTAPPQYHPSRLKQISTSVMDPKKINAALEVYWSEQD